MLGATVAAGPCPLKIVAAEPACHIQSFTNGVKTFIAVGFEGFRRKFLRANAAKGHLCGAVALTATGFEHLLSKCVNYLLTLSGTEAAKGLIAKPPLGYGTDKAVGQDSF